MTETDKEKKKYWWTPVTYTNLKYFSCFRPNRIELTNILIIFIASEQSKSQLSYSTKY